MENFGSNTRETDVFEDMRQLVGCKFISDLCLAQYRGKAEALLDSIDLSGYSEQNLQQFREYLAKND